MRSRFSRLIAWIAPAILLAGCSQAPQSGEDTAAEVQAPDITGSSAAAGVAFTFNYTFLLPAKAIAKVQRQHVTACEQLGIDRCRINGITFNQTKTDQASGSLSLLLAPADAYRFSGDAVRAVEAVKGEIAEARVEGRDAIGAGEQATQGQSSAQSEMTVLQERLKQPNLSEMERRDLNLQLQEQRRLSQENAAARQESRRSLTVTPVSFSYNGQGALAGEGRFSRAARESWNGLQDMLIVVMVVMGYLLPWALVIGIGYYTVQRFKRRRAAAAAVPEEISS